MLIIQDLSPCFNMSKAKLIMILFHDSDYRYLKHFIKSRYIGVCAIYLPRPSLIFVL